MSNALIVQLEEAGVTASQDFGYNLFGPKYNCIQINGTQVCHNDEVWMLIAFELTPQNRSEMRDGLALNVWPKTKIDFSIASNYQGNFQDFLRAVYVYIQRYRDKLRLLIFFKEGKQFYPKHAWTIRKRYGQIDYFLEGFPNTKIIRNINQDMKVEDMDNVKNLDEYIKVLLTYLRTASGHYKKERGKYDYVFNEKKPKEEPKLYSSSNKKYQTRFKSRNNNQSVNELLDGYDNDNSKSNFKIQEEDSDSSEHSKSESDNESRDKNYLDGEGSSNEEENVINDAKTVNKDDLNSFPSTTPSKSIPSNLVCYEMVNTGSCKREKCEYSHDKTAIEKFKQQRAEYRNKNASKSKPKSILRRS